MDTFESFLELNLSEKIQENLKKLKFEKPTQKLAQVIPFILEKKQDVFAQAPTGTGKTASFALPIINELCCKPKNSKVSEPR